MVFSSLPLKQIRFYQLIPQEITESFSKNSSEEIKEDENSFKKIIESYRKTRESATIENIRVAAEDSWEKEKNFLMQKKINLPEYYKNYSPNSGVKLSLKESKMFFFTALDENADAFYDFISSKRFKEDLSGKEISFKDQLVKQYFNGDYEELKKVTAEIKRKMNDEIKKRLKKSKKALFKKTDFYSIVLNAVGNIIKEKDTAKKMAGDISYSLANSDKIRRRQRPDGEEVLLSGEAFITSINLETEELVKMLKEKRGSYQIIIDKNGQNRVVSSSIQLFNISISSQNENQFLIQKNFNIDTFFNIIEEEIKQKGGKKANEYWVENKDFIKSCIGGYLRDKYKNSIKEMQKDLGTGASIMGKVGEWFVFYLMNNKARITGQDRTTIRGTKQSYEKITDLEMNINDFRKFGLQVKNGSSFLQGFSKAYEQDYRLSNPAPLRKFLSNEEILSLSWPLSNNKFLKQYGFSNGIELSDKDFLNILNSNLENFIRYGDKNLEIDDIKNNLYILNFRVIPASIILTFIYNKLKDPSTGDDVFFKIKNDTVPEIETFNKKEVGKGLSRESRNLLSENEKRNGYGEFSFKGLSFNIKDIMN